jgi:hypothetical protein
VSAAAQHMHPPGLQLLVLLVLVVFIKYVWCERVGGERGMPWAGTQ